MEDQTTYKPLKLTYSCSASFDEFESMSGNKKYCSHCSEVLYDFRNYSFEDYQEFKSLKDGKKFCGIYSSNENGELMWSQKLTSRQLLRAFVLALVFCFNSTLFSFADAQIGMNFSKFTESVLISLEGNSVFHAKVTNHRKAMQEVSVNVFVNGELMTSVMTDKDGKFSFELPSDLIIKTIKFDVAGQLTTSVEVNQTAEVYSKGMLKLKFNQKISRKQKKNNRTVGYM